MSLNERSFEGDVAEACHHFGVVGLPYGVLSGGTLTGKYITNVSRCLLVRHRPC